MHCRRCHHAGEAHEGAEGGPSLMRFGGCRVPGCTCRQFLDAMAELDEDLL